MSERDVELLSSLDISVKELAAIVEQSRQTVSKGIRAKSDYLNAGKLRRIYDAKGSEDSAECSVVQNVINNFFPDQERLVFGSSAHNALNEGELPKNGRFWFSCPDFAPFRLNYSTCLKQLSKIALSADCSLTLFVSSRDRVRCEKFWRPFQESVSDIPKVIPIIPCEIDLGCTPPLIAHSSARFGDLLFFPSDHGFIAAAQHDANRIKSILHEYWQDSDVVSDLPQAEDAKI